MASFQRLKSLYSSKPTLCLFLTFIALLITLGIVLGLVTVPGFENRHHGSISDARQYAVIQENFPDPCLIQPNSKGRYYAFATRNSQVNVQVASTPSSDISTWTYHDGYDALPHPGKWAATQVDDTAVWAPSVMQKMDGSFVMYYSALARNRTRLHCIGASTSPTVMGPYTPFDEPIICDFEAGGVIDPAYFHDPATNISYLIYKQDGNAIGTGGSCSNGNWPNTPTPLMAIELSPDDFHTPISEPFEILTNFQSDGPNVESPILWYYEYYIDSDDGSQTILKSYHIAFNAGCFHDLSYRIEHIICVVSPLNYPDWEGPGSPNGIRDCTWTRLSEGGPSFYARTLVKSGDTEAKLMAPGGPAVASSNTGGVGDGNINKDYMVFHADINEKWYGHEDAPYETQVEKGWERQRGMFVGQMQYVGTDDMIEFVGVLSPGNGTGT